MRFFENFTEAELKRYKDTFGDKFEPEGFSPAIILHLSDDVYLYKRHGSVYVLCEESEGMYEEREDGSIYYIDPVWWYKVDIEKLINDYTNGVKIEDVFEYKIYN